MKKIILSAFIIFVLYPGASIFAQRPIYGPPTSVIDSKSIFANPSLLSFHKPKLALGVKGYHIGFADLSGIPLKQGYLTLSYPFLFNTQIGAGAGVQYFDSPMYSRSFYSAHVAARLFRYVSVGVSLSALNISYDQSKFDLIHPNDPVFASGTSKTTFNSSLGIFAQPFEFLSVALGIRNINEPSLSLIGHAVNLDREYFLGGTYTQGPFKGTLELFNDQYGLDARFYLELYSSHGNFIRTGSHLHFDNMHIEAQMHISGPFSVNYHYELPMSGIAGYSAGTHMFSIIFEFDRLPRLPDRVKPPIFHLPFQEPTIFPSVEPRIFISSQTSLVKYYEKQITRVIDEDIPDETVRTLSQYDMGVLDSEFREIQYPFPSNKIAPVPDEIESTSLLSPEYREMIHKLGYIRRGQPAYPVTIVSANENLLKAFEIHNKIKHRNLSPGEIQVGTPRFSSPADSARYYTRVDRNSIVPSENTTFLEPRYVSFDLIPTYLNPSVKHWNVIIENFEGQQIKRFSGNNLDSTSLTWNLRDDANMLIEPGIYTYYIRWEDTEGSIRESERRHIYMQKFVRNITIEVTKNADKVPDKPDRINIIIKN